MGITERAIFDWGTLPFAYQETDANIRYTWRDGKWDDGVESDSKILPLHVAATCLHYGQAAFEGLKVYEAKDGRILSFRAKENAKRMQHSANMLMMQPFPVDKFEALRVLHIFDENFGVTGCGVRGRDPFRLRNRHARGRLREFGDL